MVRSLWTGYISFGLVNIPVRLVTAITDRDIHFHLLSEDGTCRLRRKLYCPETGKEFDFEHTSHGYEIAPDQYVIIRDEELDRLKPEDGRAMEIAEFVELSSIDPVYFDQTYYLLPDEGGAKGYQLLVEAMGQTKRAAIARFIMRQRQHLAVLRRLGQGLVLHTLHYADEVTTWNQMGDDKPGEAPVEKKQLEVAKELIAALGSRFDPKRYHDEYRQQLQKLIDAKAKGHVTTVTTETAEEAPPPTYDLMAALKRSLEEKKKSQAAAKKSAGKERRHRKSA